MNFAHGLSISTIINFKVHICIDRFGTCADFVNDLCEGKAYYVTNFIDFFLPLLMNFPLEVNHKGYRLIVSNCHENLITRNDCLKFQVYRR
jgi:hypothetical protein